jgi:N-methylhydantoinase A
LDHLNTSRPCSIGVDVGGSFTDIVMSDGVTTWRTKASTVPGNFALGVIEGCEKIAAQLDVSMEEMLHSTVRFGLGTTAVTNALTTHQGERVGLLTTAGFEHLPLMARGERVANDGWLDLPWVPLQIQQIAGINERIGRGGEVVRALSPADVAAQVDRLVQEQSVTAIAISFLWSFVNPAHEKAALDIVTRQYPGVPVFIGSGLQPIIREYERTMLAVMNAFCAKALDGIDALDQQLRDRGLQVPMLLLQANGGATTLAGARSAPVSLAASGPAAGVAAAAEVALQSGHEDVICGDMGGTSFDVGIVIGGKPTRRQRGVVHGVKMAQAHVEVISVGSGGGSIGWVDSRGLLRVGPQSARAYPGPACYGRGGKEPTVTDAMLLLGYLDADKFLDGAMRLDIAAAHTACSSIGELIGLNAIETAWGIRELAIADMTNAFRAHMSASGMDARALTGVTYGGSGSLFMASICESVGVPRLLVPELASVLSAYGAASADIRVERVRAVGAIAPFVPPSLQSIMHDLADEVGALLADRGVQADDRDLLFEGDFRFARQAWEIAIPLNGQFDEAEATSTFIARYKRQYGGSSLAAGVPLELMTLRAIGIGKTVRAVLPMQAGHNGSVPKPNGFREVWVERSRQLAVPTFETAKLQNGDEISGPALLDAIDNTLWVPSKGRAKMDSHRTIHVDFLSNPGDK